MAGSSKLNFTAQMNVHAQVRQAEAAIKGLAAKPLVINVQTSSKGLKALHDELARIQRKTKEVNTGFQDFADKAALAGKRFAAFTVATTGVFALASAFKKGIKDASDFQVELLKVKQVTGESSRNVNELGQEVFNVARRLGVSSKELLGVGLTLGQAGRSIKQIKDSLGALAKTRLAATFGDITDTVNALIAAQEQFKISSEDTEQVLGSINTLSAKYAVEAQDLTVAIQKAGGAFASLAQSTDKPKESLNELLALFTAVRSTSRESADTIATGLRTIFARLRRPKTISTLEAFGIDLKDQGGLLKKPLDQIRAISQAVKGLDNRDIRFSQIIEEIGGIRQQAKVIPLLQQMEKAERALITATQGANSLTKDAEIAQISLANSLAKTREEFLKLINDGFKSDEFQAFAKTVLSITNGFIQMGAAIAPIIPAVTLLAGARLFKGVGGNASAFNQISQSVSSQFSKKSIKLASGGPVGGSGRGDKVPAMLEPGEFVIPRDAASRFPRGYLEAIRKGQKPRGYSTGGNVGFNYNPNNPITSVQHAEDFAKSLFKQMGVDYKSHIKEITAFTKKEEIAKPRTYGSADVLGNMKIRIGKATEGVVAHEIGHLLENSMSQAKKDLFRKVASTRDPATNPDLVGDKYNEVMKIQTQSLLAKRASGDISNKDRYRLEKYNLYPAEIAARGFAHDPLGVAAQAGIMSKGKRKYGNQNVPPFIGPPQSPVFGSTPNPFGSGNKIPPTPPVPPTIPPSPPPNPPFIQPGGPYGPNPPFLHGFKQSAQNVLGKASDGLGRLNQGIKDNPVHAAIGSAFLFQMADEAKQVNTEFGHLVKGLATAGTQFVVLSTILNTFGKTAKDSQQLEHDSIRFQEENNKRASASDASKASQGHLEQGNRAQAQLNKNEALSQKKQKALEASLATEKSNILNPAQQKDLERIKKLDANNDILKNNSRLAPALTESIQKERNQNAGRKFYYDGKGNSLSKKEYDEARKKTGSKANESVESPRERELTRQRDFANTNTSISKGVSGQIKKNEDEKAALLAKNPGILNKENEIAKAKVKQQQLRQQLIRLQNAKKVSANKLKDAASAHNEAEKLVAQLTSELLDDKKLEALRINNELQNNRPVKGRLTKDQLAKRAKIENFAVAGSAVAGAAGSFLSDIGSDKLRNNPNDRTGATQSHAGGLLSGAAQGASFGAVASSFAGPFAPVVLGASILGGALYGLNASVKKVAEGIRDAKLDTKMKDFSRTLEDLKENKGAASLKSKNVLDVVKEFDTEFIKSKGSRDSRDRNENLAGGVEDFLRILASSGIKDDEFKNKSDGLIQFVSRFTSTSLTDLDKRFAELAVKSRDLIKVTKEVTAANLREDTRAIATAGLLSTFSDVSTTIEEFDTVLSGGVADLSSVFSRLGQVKDKSLFGRANAQASSILGGFGQSGKDFVEEGNLINEIGNKLPSILSDVFKKGTLEVQGGDHAQEISDRLGELTKNKPEAQFIKGAILQALGDKIAGGDVGKEIAGGNLKKVVDDVLEHLRKGIGEVEEQAVKLRAQELRLIESTLSKVTELRSQQTELSLSLIDIGEKRAVGNAPHGLNSAQFGAFDKNRLQEIAGQGQGTSVATLFNTLQGSRSRLKSTNADLNAGKGDLLKLEEQRRTEIETISRTERALKFLGDAASRVARIEEDIAKEKGIREGKQGILENLAFSDPSQRREITKNLSLFGNAAQNESLGGIPPSLRGGVKSILDQISPDTLVRGKGRNITARELKEKFLKEELGGNGDHIFKETNKEKELKVQREEGLARAEEATKKLREDATRQEKELTSAINTQFPQFLDRLQQLFLENREGDLRLRTQQEENKLGGLGKQKGLAGQLGQELVGTKFKNLNVQDVGELGSLLPLLQNERSSQRRIAKIQGFNELGNLGGGKEDFQPTETVKADINKLYKPLSETFGVAEADKILVNIFDRFQTLSTDVFGNTTKEVDRSLLHVPKVLEEVKARVAKEEQEKLKTTQGEIGKKGLAGNDLDVLQKNLGAINFLFNKLEGFKDSGSLTALDTQFNELTKNVGSLNVELNKVVGEKEGVKQGGIKRNINSFLKSNPGFGLGSLSGFAGGGGVPGTGNGDTVPAMLTPGEFVLKKSAVESLGMDTLHQLNNTQSFAGGGKVRNIPGVDIPEEPNLFGNSGALKPGENILGLGNSSKGPSDGKSASGTYGPNKQEEFKGPGVSALLGSHLLAPYGEKFELPFRQKLSGDFRPSVPGFEPDEFSPKTLNVNSGLRKVPVPFEGDRKESTQKESNDPLRKYIREQGEEYNNITKSQRAEFGRELNKIRQAEAKEALKKRQNPLGLSGKELLEHNRKAESLSNKNRVSRIGKIQSTPKGTGPGLSRFYKSPQSRTREEAEAHQQEQLRQKYPDRYYQRRQSIHLAKPNFNKPKSSDLAFNGTKFGSSFKPDFGPSQKESGFPNLRLAERGRQDAKRGANFNTFETGLGRVQKDRLHTPLDFSGRRNVTPSNRSVEDILDGRKPIRRASGGGTGASTISNKGSKGLECSISNESMERFNKAINDFSKPAELLASAIDKMPHTITMEGHHTLDVQVNGIQAFNTMKEEFKQLVMQEIKTTLNKFVDEKMPSVGRVV